MLDRKHRQQLRDVVAVRHIGLAFVVEGREELAGWRFAFLKLGDLVELRAGYREVCLRVVLRGRLVELGVKEEREQGHGNNVGGDGLFVILGHSESLRP